MRRGAHRSHLGLHGRLPALEVALREWDTRGHSGRSGVRQKIRAFAPGCEDERWNATLVGLQRRRASRRVRNLPAKTARSAVAAATRVYGNLARQTAAALSRPIRIGGVERSETA